MKHYIRKALGEVQRIFRRIPKGHHIEHEKKERHYPKWMTAIHKFFNTKFMKNQFIQVGILSILLMLYIEGFGYDSFAGGFTFLLRNPFAFFANALIIYATLSIAWLFRRRVFFYIFISFVWMLLGTVNGVILMFRMTPFTTADIEIIDMGLDILPSYLSTGQIYMLVAGIILAVIIFVLLFIFAPKRKEKVDYRKAVIGILAASLLLFGGLTVGNKTKYLETYFENLWNAYEQYGMPYCFLSTWLNKGIDQPVNYSKYAVKSIFKDGELDTQQENSTPNIIFLQLESFVDPDDLTKYHYSGVATPYFKELKEKYSSGHLKVPVVGGGTANTEFEAQSGMSMEFFGPGEYPYKSVLSGETCETMAYDLKKIGYATHAIHNHRGAFYNRWKVFKNLGYDDFTSLEYMNYVSKTPKNYATDDVLLGEIIGAMQSTEARDYIYTISVQGHGEYPKTKLVNNPPFKITDEDVPDDVRNAYEYYITMVSEMDNFVKNLTDELSSFGEEVVLVMYGDHLPALGMKADETVSGSTFKTEYVIWSNFEMQREQKDLAAYQLAAEVQKKIGMREGTLTVFHQDHEGDSSYLDELKLLQYDMLYGDKYIYGGVSPFKPTDMKMGYKPIKIQEISEVGGEYYIVGENFTPYSKVSLDEKILETIYLGPTLLKLLEEVDPAEALNMKVSQVEKYDAILSTTE
ncbi:MAG: sulfatase-like hydrolase/transferase [Clostridiales Family XIII bacterium]|jgi:phosphoglycerol transferase MdoB-like AlkP superfamily enzyme|nr:sulfatase-like hydrolase/transferase [Clostridiales Family XIII bacterium]